MKPLEPISSIMSTNLIKLNVSDSLSKAEHLFNTHNIRHIPVVSGNSIIGIISYTDLLRVSFIDSIEDDLEQGKSIVYNIGNIGDVMSKQIISVTSFTSIKEVATLLSESNFHAVPVVDNGILVGMISTVDLLKYFVSKYE